MSSFTLWNDLLLGEFFPPSSCGEEIWIQSSRSELDSFGLHLGGADGLVEAVRRGAPWTLQTPANCAEAAFQLARQRRSSLRPSGYIDPGVTAEIYAGANAPTYLPILALWVLASSEAEDGFYAKVGKLLGQAFPNTPQLTDSMLQVWEDLEKWSALECKARFGEFRCRVLGEHRFVGIPRSQCLVSRKDIQGVRQLFSACGLSPKQVLTPVLFKRLTSLGKEAHYLSSGLRSAFGKTTFQEPLEHLLGQMLQSWDGRRREPPGNQTPRKDLPQLEELDSTTLALAPAEGDIDGWDIRWRFPCSGYSKTCFLTVDHIRILAHMEAWGDCYSTMAGAELQEICKSILAKSELNHVEHGIECNDEQSSELGEGKMSRGRIEHRARRILVWDAPDPRFGQQLIERDLPLAGPVYLVCASSSSEGFKRYLKNENIESTAMLPKGLPSGWTLTCIQRAERLTSAQRDWLSEENEIQLALARMRFVGGRPILRGGTRLYASYDLPILEVEAPADATLESIGIRFEELLTNTAILAPSLIRRFRLHLEDHDQLVFEIKLSDQAKVLASSKLRISAPDGAGGGLSRAYSLDSLGRSKQDALGLRGSSIGADKPNSGPDLVSGPLQVNRTQLCSEEYILPYETVSGRFLDSLAQLGSVGYGEARDQLLRLAESAGVDIEPVFLLLDLRSRAHLEIQTDDKGHLIRIHAVPPTLYTLPAAYDGLPLACVCGSLRVQNWVDILNHVECITFLGTSAEGQLPTLRLATVNESELHEFGLAHGFGVDQLPCDIVSKWASSLDQAKDQLSSWGWENFSADIRQLQRLKPDSARFYSTSSRTMTVDNETRCQLFRFDDPSIPLLQVYVLGTIGTNESRMYSFIHDSRWGVWISEVTFARMLCERHSRADVYPWPIHYDRGERELWLPARIKPPVIIERALVLCSGSGPKAINLDGTPCGDNLTLIDVSSGAMIGEASSFYRSFTPATWLCYRWVPEEIAIRIASLLCGKIQPFSDK